MLSKEQELALKIMRSGENVLITGIAGSGKSFVIDKYKNEQDDKNIVVTSTTGISAILVKGTTLHSYLGIGLGNASVESLYSKIFKKKFFRKRWEELEVLIIDEISMLLPELFDKLEELARMLKQNTKPFGGIQIILTGDMLQLPPVKSKNFCFEAKSWTKTITNIICLKHNFRQNDSNFKNCLNEIRMGFISPENEKMLRERNGIEYSNELGIIPTKIFSLNVEVDYINQKELENICKDGKYYQYELEIESKEPEFVINKILKNCNLVEDLLLCVGAQVMLLVNLDIEGGLVNGSRGIITKFIDDMPVVKFLNNKEILIEYHNMKIEDNDKIICEISQIPLRVSYAVSVHKIQGQTLDCCEVDLKNIFDYGQTYVALSRVKNIESLYIKNFDKTKIMANPKALKFYNSLK